ncbi:hypothetical protein RFI_06770 [Reticulomyxa filosa]|uniref:Uncharacterized protein n=1 Tax=Reticulomyxa filosa TaxID=46433 RepID=X6NYI7_RETFI|nr:hypothetical protein RFI_06770 [Reticulomyxa filosa]|eukprot:ETO30352.1 hypothetical protein RFI_06770 [Reticulomyxa filosa]
MLEQARKCIDSKLLDEIFKVIETPFVEMTLEALFVMIEDESIAFCVCEFLDRGDSEYNIETISKSLFLIVLLFLHLGRVSALWTMLKNCRNFMQLKPLSKMLLTNYMARNDFYERLNKFDNFYNNWDLEINKRCIKNGNDKEYLVNMKDGCAFKRLWDMSRAEMKNQGKLTFETSMDILFP